MGDICRISTLNRSMCTLSWNKNISTFWINGAFYYKIKSCAFVWTFFTSDMSPNWIELLLLTDYSKNHLGDTSDVSSRFDSFHPMSFCQWWTLAEEQRWRVPRKLTLKVIQVGTSSKKSQSKKWLPKRRVRTGVNGFGGLTGSGNGKRG